MKLCPNIRSCQMTFFFWYWMTLQSGLISQASLVVSMQAKQQENGRPRTLQSHSAWLLSFVIFLCLSLFQRLKAVSKCSCTSYSPAEIFIIVTAIVAGMLNKFLNVRKLASFSSRGRPKPVAQPQQETSSAALKIVQAGGIVEYYYMAIPAVNIMKKYPSFILTRPEVFGRPWDSLVRSDEMLTPGEKFYVVPRRTVRKLRRRIKNPNGEVFVNSFVSESSIDVSKDGLSSKSFLRRNEASDSSEVSGSFCVSRKKINGTKKHVTFSGIDAKQKPALPAIKNNKDDEGIAERSKKKSNLQQQGGKRKSRNEVSWHPSLTAISESHGPGE